MNVLTWQPKALRRLATLAKQIDFFLLTAFSDDAPLGWEAEVIAPGALVVRDTGRSRLMTELLDATEREGVRLWHWRRDRDYGLRGLCPSVAKPGTPVVISTSPGEFPVWDFVPTADREWRPPWLALPPRGLGWCAGMGREAARKKAALRRYLGVEGDPGTRSMTCG